MKAFKYYNDTYRALNWCLIGDRLECEEWIKKHFNFKGNVDINPEYAGCSFVLERKNISYCQIIWLMKMDFTVDDYVTLSHECLHTATKILSRCGVDYSECDKSESLNYLHDAIYGAFLKKINQDYKKSQNIQICV